MIAEVKGKKTKKSSSSKKSQSSRVLMHPEEWEDPNQRKVISEYHEDGSSETPATSMPETEGGKPESPGGRAGSHKHLMQASQVFDISTVEMLAYALSRSLFRRGVQIPLKVKDVVDMDIAVKDTDIILNTNDVSFELPPLQIWHVIFSYKGRPVFEYGRGVPDSLKIHYGRAFPFLMAMWLGGRKRRKARKEATEKACRDLAQSST